MSPRVPRDDHNTDSEPITGSFLIPATLRDVKNAREEIDERIDRTKKSTETRAVVLFVLGGLATLGTGFLSVRAIAQDAGAVPVQALAAELEGVKVRASMLEKGQLQQADDVRETKQSVNDLNRKLDLVLDRFRIPNPAHAPRDGGQ